MAQTFTTDVTQWQGSTDEIKAGSKNLLESGAAYSLKTDIKNLLNAFQDLSGETLYVTDVEGNVVAKITANGLECVDVIVQNKKLSDFINGQNSILENFYTDTLYVTDADGNVVFYVDNTGVHSVGINYKGKIENVWLDKVMATYGDSVTAINDGDFTYPFATNKWNWGNKIAQFFTMSKHYGRGIGGSGYMWNTQGSRNGGSIAWVTPTGVEINRLDAYDLDEWNALSTKVYPTGVTQEMINQGLAIQTRTCMASWLRITTMFPESIKDEIDVVLIMAHNDGANATEPSFITGDTTDTEWAGSDYYAEYGGDYNLNSSFKGAIASTIMKMQAWMPNARLVLMAPISGQGSKDRFKAYFNTLPSVSVNDIYRPNTSNLRLLVTAITDNESEKSVTFAYAEGMGDIIWEGFTSLVKVSGSSSSPSTLTFTEFSNKNIDGSLIGINLEIPSSTSSGVYAQVGLVNDISQKLSIPFIDVFRNCGINGFNRIKAIADTIHPYSNYGSKMIAQAIIGSLKAITPNINEF
jgi:hypothetical protein